MLQASNISKRYGDDIILDGVSFVVNPGQRVALIGPNGCGKTTLLRCILGCTQPDGVGHEQSDGGSVILSPPDLRLGYLAQGLEYAPDATISDFLLASQARQRQVEADVQRLAEAVAAATGLTAGAGLPGSLPARSGRGSLRPPPSFSGVAFLPDPGSAGSPGVGRCHRQRGSIHRQ